MQGSNSSSRVTPNVILFGERGAGKSSIINMLAYQEVAEVSSIASGCTLRSQRYRVTIRNLPFNVYDTAGLNEGEEGRVPNKEAISAVIRLVHNLSKEGGISLLVFVTRGRIRDAAVANWKLFREIICRCQVPAVLVVTGLEQEDNMDYWWDANMEYFLQCGIIPQDRGCCVTSTKGRLLRDGSFAFGDEYAQSRRKIQNLIYNNILASPWHSTPFDIDGMGFFTQQEADALAEELGRERVVDQGSCICA